MIDPLSASESQIRVDALWQELVQLDWNVSDDELTVAMERYKAADREHDRLFPKPIVAQPVIVQPMIFLPKKRSWIIQVLDENARRQ